MQRLGWNVWHKLRSFHRLKSKQENTIRTLIISIGNWRLPLTCKTMPWDFRASFGWQRNAFSLNNFVEMLLRKDKSSHGRPGRYFWNFLFLDMRQYSGDLLMVFKFMSKTWPLNFRNMQTIPSEAHCGSISSEIGKSFEFWTSIRINYQRWKERKALNL